MQLKPEVPTQSTPYRWRLVLLTLSALSAMAPLAIDIVLPSFHLIESELSIAPGSAAATISFFLLGFATGPLVFGAMSDRLGRRPLLLFGLILFAITSLICALAPNLSTLLIARLIQGMGAGAAAALPIAIVRDLFEGTKAGQALSVMIIVGSFAPIIAPLVGVTLLALGGWRTIFFALATAGALFTGLSFWTIDESLKPQNRQSGGAAQVINDYVSAFRHPIFFRYALANALNFGCMFAYVSASPSVFIETFGMSIFWFGCAFALTAGGIILGGLWNKRQLARGADAIALLDQSLIISLIASGVLFFITLIGKADVASVLPLLIVNNFAVGMARPNATYAAMHPMPHIAGSASALLRGMQMLMGAGASAIVSVLHGHDAPFVMAVLMTATSILALMCSRTARSQSLDVPS